MPLLSLLHDKSEVFTLETEKKHGAGAPSRQPLEILFVSKAIWLLLEQIGQVKYSQLCVNHALEQFSRTAITSYSTLHEGHFNI
jgi:hypothetical protein